MHAPWSSVWTNRRFLTQNQSDRSRRKSFSSSRRSFQMADGPTGSRTSRTTRADLHGASLTLVLLIVNVGSVGLGEILCQQQAATVNLVVTLVTRSRRAARSPSQSGKDFLAEMSLLLPVVASSLNPPMTSTLNSLICYISPPATFKSSNTWSLTWCLINRGL